MAALLHGLDELGVVFGLVVAEGDLVVGVAPEPDDLGVGQLEDCEGHLYFVVLRSGWIMLL